MNRKLIITEDGSHTVQLPALQVTYHSVHGAIQESMQVYINSGLLYIIDHLAPEVINVFEMGFGTGLNAMLTTIEAERKSIVVNYTSVENAPLTRVETTQLNYPQLLGHATLFRDIHGAPWGQTTSLSKFFNLLKLETSIRDYQTTGEFHLIYFDAFDPAAQPELWTENIFSKMYDMLVPGGALVTYSSKGEVRRRMKAAGFQVTKLPGPPGKREITRAEKVVQS